TWRDLNKSRASIQNKLRYRRARFAEMIMHPETEDNAVKYGHLNEAKMKYPGTKMRLVYELSSKGPG
ncbi:MAG: hypothetical protein L3J69_18205, partial [Desulfobacula sp.]|nr:hypothetical protein [Desulfobacula sp.]